MKTLLISHAAMTAAGALILALVFGLTASGNPSENQLISFLSGAGVSFLHLGSLVYAYPKLLAKKQVALALAVIVFKFAILGWILYLVAQAGTIAIGWFALGLGLVIPSVLVAGFQFASNESSPE